MKFEANEFDLAKSIRLTEVNARIEHCLAEFKYWESEYCKTGDRFTQQMCNVTFDIYYAHKDLKRFLENPNTICRPRIYDFPKLETAG